MISDATDLLHEARVCERGGRLLEAIEGYQAAIASAEQGGEPTVLAEALRRLAVVCSRRNGVAEARDLCQRSYEVARDAGSALLAGEAVNTAGAIEMMTGSLSHARRQFLVALELGGESRELCARVEHNLGILANIQGNLEEAAARYGRALEACRGSGDEHGCALAYHNLGMVSADCERLDEAESYFTQSLAIAERAGDRHLQGLCLMSQAEVYLERQRFEDAQGNAERALAIFDQQGAGAEKSGAYRVIGMVYRETGRPELAEARLRSAVEMAVAAGSVLNQAEATQELALLYRSMGRNREALALLNAAHRFFGRLDARRDLLYLDGKVGELEETYLAVVREWGQSIESRDSYTFGHCERVAQNAATIARTLGLDDEAQTAIRIGAYLHDLGKVKVPHEILNKPGPLTAEELELMRMHPVWGAELLAGVEFPWVIEPIVRSHHERYDGTGYPDRLMGDEIPVSAQIVGIADVYDALTTNRPYRAGLSLAQACAEMTLTRGAWSTPVFEAFLLSLPRLARSNARTTARTGGGTNARLPEADETGERLDP